jgi:hypothetical protein
VIVVGISVLFGVEAMPIRDAQTAQPARCDLLARRAFMFKSCTPGTCAEVQAIFPCLSNHLSGGFAC